MKFIFKHLIPFILVTGLFSFGGCQKESLNSLTVNPESVNFEKQGGISNITIKTDADSWNITHPASGWLTLSGTNGTSKSAEITLTVNSKALTARKDTLSITAGDARPVKVVVSQLASDYLYDLATNVSGISLKKTADSTSISINTDAPLWNISSDTEWLRFSQTTGNNGTTLVKVIASANAGDSRTANITLSAENASTVQIPVTQQGSSLYPSYNTSPAAPDLTGMSSTAIELAAKIKLGWNIGNTMEAIGGETAWGNPLVSKALIDLVKQNGFNAIRIPCSWNQYMANSTTAQLKTEWLNRVKQVVQYCVDNNMYVLLNIHWDGGWLENN